jgi:parvulin-like peptidyl-prolyl isomerase
MNGNSDEKHSAELQDDRENNRPEESTVLRDILAAAGISFSHKKGSESVSGESASNIGIMAEKVSEKPESTDSDDHAGVGTPEFIGSAPEESAEGGVHTPSNYVPEQRDYLGETPSTANNDSGKSKAFPLIMICAAVLIIVCLIASAEYLSILFEPKPPQENIAATYNGKSISSEQLMNFISRENIREREHMICEKHGFDHSKCDELEECETHPIHSMKGYQQIVKMIAVQDMIVDWADKNGVTKREDVSHTLKDLVEGANVDSLINELHAKEITPDSIPKWEVQKYFDDNKDVYADKAFSDVEREIRNILVKQKDTEFFPAYIEELKKSAGLEINLDILKVAMPTEQQIQLYYRGNPDRFVQTAAIKGLEMRIAQSSSGADLYALGQEAVKRLQSGEDFDEVAGRYAQGGMANPVEFERGTRSAVYEEQAWGLEPGGISEAFEDNGDTVIFKLLSKSERGLRPLPEVRESIRQELLRANMDAEYALRKDEALFIIHGRRYTLGEFQVEFKELPAEYQDNFSTFDEKKFLVEQMIAKELLLEEYGDDAESDEDRHRIDHLKQEYLSQVLHKEKVDAQLADITDEEARGFYDLNKRIMIEAPTVKISLIGINRSGSDGDYEKNRGIADEALSAIRGGADFGDIAKQYSQDATARNGGVIPVWLHERDLPREAATVIFALKKGEVTNVIETHNRFYIFKIDDRTEERQQSYEEVADVIKSYLQNSKHLELEASVEAELLSQAQFTVYNRTLRNLLKENEGAESK